MKVILRAMVLAAALGSAAGLQAQVTPAGDQTWTVNIRNADIQAFISQVADMTGKNFVVDPRVRARDVTVISTKALSADEVYELFLSVLQVHGYAAVPSGDIIKIVTNTTAKQSNLPLVEGDTQAGEELVTRVIPVENSPVEELVPVLRPLVPQYGHLAAVGSANALIISDHGDNIGRMEAIIRHLDRAESEDVTMIPLRHAFAGDLVKLLENLTPQTSGRRGKAGAAKATVVADERTNRLIVRGDRATRERILEMVRDLDTPDTGSSGVKVVRLSHGDAAAMAELLKNFAEGKSATKGGGEGQAATTPGSGVSIQADESLNALVIRAEPAMMKELQAIISQLDVRRAQILIEAAIVEITGSDADALGFQYAAGNPDEGVGAINFNPTDLTPGVSVNQILRALVADDPTGVSLADGITVGGGDQDDDGDLRWGVLVQALASTTNANLLSTPKILTLDNQEASIIVGQNVPFVTGSSTNTGAGVSNPFQTIQREDVGLTLKVTPHLAGLETIRLELEQESSSIQSSAGEAADIITAKRKIQTTVLADDGETIVLGGLISDDIRETVRKVPILGDIPFLGALFRSKGRSHEKRNLMVFLRPAIMPSKDELVDATREKYMGLTALQFSVNEEGELVRNVPEPLPKRVDQLFEGRNPAGEDIRRAFEAQSGADSAQ